ncbi:amidase [Sphingomonas sp. SUN039]|uniref:amidase n=1 Tax=Sphingomonas sp. SUN039 TaxID=2937787 RepID=UPI0021647E0F|nr:amidase [Sphingomonas sp. SUN039]UVO55272.1 amidase [Sphingomonas sp. SUN039]
MQRVLLAAMALTLSGTALAGPPTAEREAAAYVAHIATIDRAGPRLISVIAVNPDWRAQARALDREATRGPLHGKAILIKDNIETKDRMATTAGSMALAANFANRDAPLVARLRRGGALILGKTNLSEWANIRSSRSMSGWSAIGGIVRNPYALDRTACGSSSGSGAAIAAGLAWGAVGTETDGSIVCPASINGIVGLKPTVGLVSRTHVVPISHSQDTPGPMTRSVRDAALMLTAMAGSDAADTATAQADTRKADYAAALTGSVAGVRIGVLRGQVGDNPAVKAVFEAALAKLAGAGAVLVDIARVDVPPGLGKAEGLVLYTELKVDLDAYLATTPTTVKTRTLAELIAFNRDHAAKEMPFFGQETFIKAQATKGLSDPDYLAALKLSRDGARGVLDRLMADNKVALLVAPTQGPAWMIDPVQGDQAEGPSASSLPAMSGYPHLTVPMGQVMGLPVGLSFMGPAWSEGALLNAGDAYERVRGPFPKPTFARTVSATLDPPRR